MKEKINPLNIQVGGDHYKNLSIQPAAFIHRNNIGYLAGNAIDMLVRYKDKGGKQDLEKAIHWIQLLIKLEYGDKT
uniref:Putative structural protein n=1 Tax=viral metagenome TaxID=1070528 RepID=A0A6M3JEY3_9ZZZZ